MQNRVWPGQTAKTEAKAGAPGSEPISAIEAKPQSDHNSLTNKPQLAAVQNQPPTDFAAKPQPDDTETHFFLPIVCQLLATWPCPTLSRPGQLCPTTINSASSRLLAAQLGIN